MTVNLFHKVAFITDLHFGRGGNSPIANQDNLDFLAWAIDRARSWGAETLIMGGDWHNNRFAVGVHTIHYSMVGLDMVNEGFKRSIFIAGNHDLFYREKRDVSSIKFAEYLPNIEILANPCEVDGVTFLPWLVGDEPKHVKNIKSRYVFGHLEMPGFLMNANVAMPDSTNLLNADQFAGVEAVFTGHFHHRQRQGRVIYTGNIMPFDFADAGDGDRGLMLMQWGHDPIFEPWPDQPLYMHAKLSDILDKPTSILRPKMTLRVAVDLPIVYDEAQELRDMLVTEYGLRKIELGQPPRDDAASQEFAGTVIYKSVDQMMIDGLMSLDSPTLNKQKLVNIFTGLTNL